MWLLPLLPFRISLEWILIPALIILFLFFMVIGWILNLYGSGLVERLISEATILERKGHNKAAERAYKKAFTVFDSFILSYVGKKKNSASLISRMARFYVARAEKDLESEAFIISYLYSHPNDSEVARDWLQRIRNRPDIQKEHQELAFRIGSSQPDNIAIQKMLANLYLYAKRSDFPALQTYRRVLEKGGKETEGIVKALSEIFLSEGRADEWALDIYLQAYRLNRDNLKILDGIAACTYWLSDSDDINTRSFREASELLSEISTENLEEMRHGFKPSITQPTKSIRKKPIRRYAVGEAVFNAIVNYSNHTYRTMKTLIYLIYNWTTRLVHFIKQSRRSRQVLKWTVTMALALVIIMLVINTIGYLLKSEPASEKEKVVKEIVTDPFTLQVAAYLKQEHAEKYVAFLKEHKLDAYWTETIGEKRRYYQVRVSHFPDKASARTYGESLKSKGIIEDFYVANYP